MLATLRIFVWAASPNKASISVVESAHGSSNKVDKKIFDINIGRLHLFPELFAFSRTLYCTNR